MNLRGYKVLVRSKPVKDEVVFIRHGFFRGNPLEDRVYFVKAEPGDSRAVNLPDHEGKWIYRRIENFLGDFSYLHPGAHPLDIPLGPNSKLLSYTEYKEALKQKSLVQQIKEQETRELLAAAVEKQQELEEAANMKKLAVLKKVGLTEDDLRTLCQ